MKFNFAIITAALLSLYTLKSFGQIVELGEHSHAGSNCEAANQAQANLMTWSKEGITNNSAADLYVICPADIDPTIWRRAGTGTSTVFAFVFMNLPAGYGPVGAAAPTCILRVTSSGAGTSAPQIPIIVQGRIPMSAYYPAIPGDNYRIAGAVTFELNPVSGVGGGPDLSAHILCVLPKNGGAISSYTIGTAVSGRVSQ